MRCKIAVKVQTTVGAIIKPERRPVFRVEIVGLLGI
jgi:hypothetical protein